MKIGINILSILGVVSQLFSGARAENHDFPYETLTFDDLIKKPSNNNDVNKNNDNFYMILVNNTSDDGENLSKRSLNQFINEISSEISDIIIDNKETYEDAKKLQEFEQKNIALEKRSLKKRSDDENESNLAYPISTLNDKTIIYSYLSKDIVDIIEKLPYVMACVPDVKLTRASAANNNLKRIEIETNWSGVATKEDSDIHLSLISQGKYDDQLIGEYDKTYYYPSTAGKDVDIFIIDNGFNFRHSEFSNKNERIAKCIFKVENAKIVASEDEEVCEKSDSYHGEKIADLAGGLIHGVAPKANIYGIAMEEEPDEDSENKTYNEPSDYSEEAVMLLSHFIAAMQHIRDSLFRPNKAIFNFSYGLALDYFKENDKYMIDYWEEFINELADEGAVFVAAAGNEGIQVDRDNKPFFYPCSYENVICVGAVDNYGKNKLHKLEIEITEITNQLRVEFNDELYMKGSQLYNNYMTLKSELPKIFLNKTMDSSNYEVAYFSNYGKKVNIHAPAYVTVSYQDKLGDDYNEIDVGTSYSSPIVVGVAATIMSEHPDKKFDSKSMLKYLNKIGEKNIINGILEGNPNIFINNGKHIVYSQDDNYYGCGPRSGDQKCLNNLFCTKDGYCSSDKPTDESDSSSSSESEI